MIELAQAGHGKMLLMRGILLHNASLSKRNFAHYFE